MANKNVFSYARNGKRKLGHSKFDMGFEHITSGNFGALKPVACFETLPDDYWDISQNTVTLLKPLTAPAMTRINQNFYGAYVRNQQIWEHWNDFISNGTAYGDVYGNNVTNQALDNAWEVPNIPAPYIQSILKLGAGNAVPVHQYQWKTLVAASYNTGNLYQDLNKDFNALGLPLLLELLVCCVTLPNDGSKYLNGFYHFTDALAVAINLPESFYRKSVSNSPFYFRHKSIVESGFNNLAYDLWLNVIEDAAHPNSFFFEFNLSVYCSERQNLALIPILGGVHTTTGSNSSSIGSNAQQFYDVNSSSVSDTLHRYRYFADDISADPTTSTSAFITERSQYYGSDGKILKSIDFYPRVIDSSVSVSSGVSLISGSPYTIQSIHSPFFGFRYRILPVQSSSKNYTRITSAQNVISSGTSYPLWILSDGTSGNFFDFYVNVNELEVFDFFESVSSKLNFTGVTTADYISAYDAFALSAQNHQNIALQDFSGEYGNACFGFGYSHSFTQKKCSISFYCDLVVESNSFPNTLGFDDTSFFVYLCQNSLQLCDSLNIKVDPLCSRPFYHYRYERVNALPFMAYSKIWDDNFRNPVVSSPELDYKTVNGCIFADSNYVNNFLYEGFFKQPSVIPPYFAQYQESVSDFPRNGWVIELTCMPRNSQGSKFHTHLPVKTFQDVLTLLTGFGFLRMFRGLQQVDLNLSEFYLPQYYNGLLHLKYQNFNKDYFTSAMLDPMSGANQVAVGSTINELRENEAKQHWWERTSMYRSIKNFFQGTYGITPIELPQDSRITGVDHTDIQIGEVIQTSGSTPENPQGSRSGLGGAHGKGSLCHGHANEHGWIFVIMSHTVESQYLQTYDKMWDVKDSFLDYPTVDFAGIGNESILQKEVNYTTVPTLFFNEFDFANSSILLGSTFASPVSRNASKSFNGFSNPNRISNMVQASSTVKNFRANFNIANSSGTSLDNVFGFIPRYSTYKFKFDQVSGQFRHELSFWHTFKRYFAMPILCHEFVNWELAADDEELNRIFAVSEDAYDDKFCIDCFINATVDRALPFVCVPSTK